MIDTFDCIRQALDRRTARLDVFFRDDDGGWADEQLLQLLDLFALNRCPIDLAMIPVAASKALASVLRARRHAGERIGFHQHGYGHLNHEATGRPCEFGPSRTPAEQAEDITRGRARLLEHFEDTVDPIFTPPWNRCAASLGQTLAARGFTALSRDASAGALGVPGLSEWPVSLDWFAKARGQRLNRARWAETAARQLGSSDQPLGVMLHHAAMDDVEMTVCARFVSLIVHHPNVRVVAMRELAG